MPDYNEKHYSADSIIPHKNAPPRFDFERLTRFMSYGFIMSPVQFQWYGFLSRVFPITKQSAAIPALKRVAFDQLIFAPIGRPPLIFAERKKSLNIIPGLACFFTFMTVTEGGGSRAVFRKFQDLYLPSLKANFMLWPAAQLLNFRVIPFRFQIVSLIYIIYTDGYLLLMWISSHSCLQLASPGPHISRSRTRLKMINYDSSFSDRLLHERPADLVGLAWLESNRIGVNRIGWAQYQGYKRTGSFHNRYRWCRHCNDMYILFQYLYYRVCDQRGT